MSQDPPQVQREWRTALGLHGLWFALGAALLVGVSHHSRLSLASVWPWLVLAFVGAGVALYGLVVEPWQRRALARFDRAMLPSTAHAPPEIRTLSPSAERVAYVGVAYQHSGKKRTYGPAWDRGFLRIEDGFVCFEGHGPSFRLPVRCVVGIGSKPAGLRPYDMRNAVALDWRGPDDALHTVWLQPFGEMGQPPSRAGARRFTLWSKSELDRADFGSFEGSNLPWDVTRGKFKDIAGELWLSRFLPTLVLWIAGLAVSIALRWNDGPLSPFDVYVSVLAMVAFEAQALRAYRALLTKLKVDEKRILSQAERGIT